MGPTMRCLILMVWLAALYQAARAEDALYDVLTESSQRVTAAGDKVAYDLYRPTPRADLPAGPFPAVVLLHGFSRDKRYFAGHAKYMAQHGIIVMTPNISSLWIGNANQ